MDVGRAGLVGVVLFFSWGGAMECHLAVAASPPLMQSRTSFLVFFFLYIPIHTTTHLSILVFVHSSIYQRIPNYEFPNLGIPN